MQFSPESAARAVLQAGVPAYADAPTRASAERDFGNIANGACLTVAEPTDAASCARLLESLAHVGVGCTPRGAGYSQSGQSVARDSVSLSTRRLDAVARIDAGATSITVGGGASLRRVLHALDPVGLTPPALPLNLDMSVGGLLSAGGLGSSSHRHGPVVANVHRLRVVTGDGKEHVCSPAEHPELFHSVLGGLGQFGIITEATLALRQAPRTMRVLTLLYDDRRTWLEDQKALSLSGIEAHLEGLCWAGARGLRSTPTGPAPFTYWTYALHVAVDAADTASIGAIDSSIRPLRTVDEHETDWASYVHRYGPRFAAMVSSGAWSEPHPWFEALLPLDRTEEVLGECLDRTPAELGEGHRLMLVDPTRAPRGFVSASGDRCALFGMLPMAVPQRALPRALSFIDTMNRRVLDVGGRRYLSGWLGDDPTSYFRAHFGDRYDAWLAARRRFDPQGVFRSGLFPAGNRS